MAPDPQDASASARDALPPRRVRVQRWLARAGVLLLALPFLLALAAWLLLRGSLPVLEGAVELPGLSAPVALARDANG